MFGMRFKKLLNYDFMISYVFLTFVTLLQLYLITQRLFIHMRTEVSFEYGNLIFLYDNEARNYYNVSYADKRFILYY
jgi:hypothetical protein